MLKKVLLAALCLPMASAFAITVNPGRPSVASKIQTGKKALEAKVGFKLNARQEADLESLVQYDNESNNLVQVGGLKTKAIYCVAGEISAGSGMLQGGCLHIWSGTAYGVAMLGVGMNLQLTGTVFRLKVAWDGTRYDSNFDPIPGNYAMATQGGTLGVGGTYFVGDSGNKTVSGLGANVGLGIDFGSISWMNIQD